MTKSIKKILLTLCCAVLVLGGACTATGCGNKEEGDKAKITVAMLSSEKKAFEKLEKAYESLHTDVDIRIVTYTAYETAMTNYVKNNNWPDVVWTAGDQHAGYSGAGHFMDLKTFDAADDTFDFAASGIYPELLDATHYAPDDDGYWFMPRDYNVPILFVNKTHLSKAGIDFDTLKNNWNYETFIAACNTLKAAYADASSKDTDNIRTGFLPTAYPCELDAVKMSNFTGILRSFGGNMFDTSKTAIDEICTFGSAASVQAYETFYNTFYRGGLVDPADTTASLFNQKSAAFWLAVRPEVANIPAGIDYDFLPNPFAYAGVGCGGYAITNKADGKTFGDKKISQYAWEFLKYVVSEDGQNALSESGLLVPCITSLQSSGVWTTYGNTGDVQRNHLAFTQYEGTKVGLNDVKVFAPSYNTAVDRELVSLVTYCIQYDGNDFTSGFAGKAKEVMGRMRTYKLAKAEE